jgi:acetolactate synthase-1/2/3 large subunit
MSNSAARATARTESDSSDRTSYINELFEPDEAPSSVVRAIQSEPLSAARHLVEALVAAGVDTFFGIPGGPVSPIFDAVLNTRGARLVESRHETGAAFAAAGYHRASGRVPAVLVTAGPGATNAVTGIVSAHLERVPMLVISGDVAWAASGGRMLQDSGPEGIAIEQMLAKTTRATVRVTHAKSAASQGLAALAAAIDPANPGPALLVVPIQLGAAIAPALRVEAGRVARTIAPPHDAVVEACEILARAERPLLVLGAGCRSQADKIRRLVDLLDVPFVTTPRAKGIVSEEHPRSLRHGGLAASMWARKYTAAGVDGAVVLGTDLDDCSIGPTPYIAQTGRLVHVDLDATVLNRNLPTALGVVADAGAFAEAMVEVIVDRGLRNGRVSRVVRELRSTSPFDVAEFASDESPRVKPWRVLADLEHAAGREARFVTDIGEHMLFALHYLTAKGPDAFTIHLGLGSMGSGICGAVGLALGDRSRRVVCVCGDGGMQMAGAEALVAVRERLPIVFAVFNDARYNMVYHGYKYVFGREASWDAPQIDFAMWARSMGMNAVRVNHPGEITSVLLDRLTMDGGPCVMDIRVDRDVRLSGGGRNEALQHMSMSAAKS